MESALIYSVGSHMKNIANWSAWVYCGIEDDIKEDVIENAVNEFFPDRMLYLVTNRKASGEVNKQDILERIKKGLGQNDFFIWDINFKKVIEFNKIGVMRNGLIPNAK
jgi:hypothetical protein